MLGLLVLLLLIGYATVWWVIGRWVVRRMHRVTTKVAAGVGVVALASVALLGDEIVGRYQLGGMCRNDGGYRYYATAPRPEGLLLHTASKPVADELLRKYGLKYVESEKWPTSPNKVIVRYSISENGEVAEAKVSRPLAKYKVTFEQGHLSSSLLRRTYAIREASSSKILGAYYHYVYFGGWVSRLLPRSISAECRNEPLDVEEILLKEVFGIGK